MLKVRNPRSRKVFKHRLKGLWENILKTSQLSDYDFFKKKKSSSFIVPGFCHVSHNALHSNTENLLILLTPCHYYDDPPHPSNAMRVMGELFFTVYKETFGE